MHFVHKFMERARAAKKMMITGSLQPLAIDNTYFQAGLQHTMAALKGLGAVLRGAGRAIEELGCALQGKLAYRETREDDGLEVAGLNSMPGRALWCALLR